jgi:phage-related protein
MSKHRLGIYSEAVFAHVKKFFFYIIFRSHPFETIGAGVKETRISEDGNAFRIIYVAKFSEKIHVLHSFHKKTQKTRSKDINIEKTRYNAIANEENS